MFLTVFLREHMSRNLFATVLKLRDDIILKTRIIYLFLKRIGLNSSVDCLAVSCPCAYVSSLSTTVKAIQISVDRTIHMRLSFGTKDHELLTACCSPSLPLDCLTIMQLLRFRFHWTTESCHNCTNRSCE